MNRSRTTGSAKKLIPCAMFTAVLVVLAQLSIPMPVGVPVTLQTFAMALCGYILGWKNGAFSVLVYLLLGGVGLPVFSGFRGGVGVLFGLTGGYLWGFLPMVILCGLGKRQKNKPFSVLLGMGGLLLCHALGGVQFSVVTQSPIWYAFWVASLPYLGKDVVSVVGAYLVGLSVCRRLRKVGVLHEPSCSAMDCMNEKGDQPNDRTFPYL